MSIKAIIVDDEALAREMLANMINTLDLDIEILHLCKDLPEALKTINKLKPNLVFMDIDMPLFKGIEINQFIPKIDFDIIFTTAHEQYAIDAIKLGAFDYLLKPIDIDELKICIEKLLNKETKETTQDKTTTNRLIVNTVQHIHFIDYNNIIYLKAEGAYTKIVTIDSEITASKNLKYYEELLINNQSFSRVHKSFIINKLKINTINKSRQQILLTNGDHVAIAQDKIEKLLQNE